MTSTLDEHLGYIADAARTERFRRAIAQAVKPGDVIVDVGCGFGILGLLCLEAGAARVWGIDRTDAIEIAREAAARAGYADRYHCFRDISNRVDLPERVDVVICDHVGYFGLDYGVVGITADARKRFMKPGGRVIPGLLRLEVAGVQSAKCREKAEGWAAPQVPEWFRWLREYGVNSKHSHEFTPDEVIAPPQQFATVDLNADVPDTVAGKAELVASRDGVLDGLAGWFDCEIVPGVTMSNSPLAEGRIDRPQVFLAFDRPMRVAAGERVSVSVSLRHDVGTISWTARNLATGETARQTTWRSKILAPEDLVPREDRVPALGPLGAARRIVLGYVDGQRSAEEIERAVRRDHPALLPSDEAISVFIQDELARGARAGRPGAATL